MHHEALGTAMRHLLDSMESDIARYYADHGLVDYRPRFSPVIRHLAAVGPTSIRGLSEAIGVTHSAASQTVAQLVRTGYLRLEAGDDARRRIAHLTPRAEAAMQVIEAEWAASAAAIRGLDEELPVPLGEMLARLREALAHRSFGDRMRE
ncbi:DNA-binding MarR family transcriptional regulator [Stackebrandtia endophytica]|uniref:DNA-binding MarR family transcriptional regulator n=1 Tax=Stackebrandtia endophytica TaxID=1496996 RepID=A0A543AT28_9ACTN|nr:helix-turn-helix domain-containing protein [Stackebrandtia endophytica]TQL75718.1 DNA-binding MarR family transcriptional regulator [Stackebrandtia endophytica]